MKSCGWIVLFFLCIHTLHAQHLTDILINDEPDSCGFKITSASLHVLSPEKFMVIWKQDMGNLQHQAWALIFDKDGNPLYEQFRVPGDNYISPLNNNMFTIMDLSIASNPAIDSLIIKGQHFNNNSPLSTAFRLEGKRIIICDTFPGGENAVMTRTSWGNVFTNLYCGELSFAIQHNYQSQYQPTWQPVVIQDSAAAYYNDIYYAEQMSLFPAADSSFAWLVTKKLDISGESNPSSHGNKIHLIKLDSSNTSHTLQAKTIIIDTTQVNYLFKSWLHAELEDDTTIVMFWAKKDSLIETHVDTSGVIREYRTFYIMRPDSIDDWYELGTFLFSNKQQEKRILLAGYDNYVKRITIQDHHIVSISENFINVSNSNGMNLKTNFYQSPDGPLFYCSKNDYSIDLYQWDNNTVNKILTWRTETNGANQTVINILPVNEEKCKITYKESESYRAVLLKSDGGVSISQEWPDTVGMYFNESNELLDIYSTFTDGAATINLKTWDVNTNSIIQDAPLISPRTIYTFGKLDDSYFYIIQAFAQDEIECMKFNTNGELVDSLHIQISDESNAIAAHKLQNGKIWINYNNRYYLWDVRNSTFSTYPNIPAGSWSPMSDSLLASAAFTKNPEGFYRTHITLINTFGDTLVHEYYPVVTHSPKPFALDDNHFILLDSYYGQHVFYLFDTVRKELNPEGIDIFPNWSYYYSNLVKSRVGNHLVFACSDIRDDETGYNVYASIFNINDLVTGIDEPQSTVVMPRSFELSLPSPNPGYAGKTVQFQLNVPGASQVEFRLYNILGQQINVRKQFFNAGAQQFRYTLPNLPSGVYFMRAINTDQVAVQKLLIMR